MSQACPSRDLALFHSAHLGIPYGALPGIPSTTRSLQSICVPSYVTATILPQSKYMRRRERDASKKPPMSCCILVAVETLDAADGTWDDKLFVKHFQGLLVQISVVTKKRPHMLGQCFAFLGCESFARIVLICQNRCRWRFRWCYCAGAAFPFVCLVSWIGLLTSFWLQIPRLVRCRELWH